MDLDRALEHALDGRAVLFVGAGFSSGAENLLGQPFKSGRQLGTYFAQKLSIPENTPLDDAAEEFTRVHGPDLLITELQQQYTARTIAIQHETVAKVPWHRVYTTNYDNVLETAYTRVARRLTPVTSKTDLRTIPKTNIAVHFNGYIDALARDTLGSDFKLTDTSYVAASLLDSPWFVLFRQDLRLARSVFFIGYSLSDLDIRRLLFDTPALQDKTFFILGDQLDAITARRVERFGSVLPMTAADLAAALTEKLSVYDSADASVIGEAVQKWTPPLDIPTFSDQSVFDLLFLGTIRPAFAWNSLHGGPRYFLERAGASDMVSRILARDGATVLHSDLGNGKTAFLEGVKCRAYETGCDVYVVTARTDDLFLELDNVLQSQKRTLLVIDDYPDWLDVVEYVGIRAGSELSVVLAARSTVHDVLIDRLCGLLRCDSVTEVALDRLRPSDLEWVSDYFDEYGLWGSKAGWSQRRKLSYLDNKCGRQFQGILLETFGSQHILDRLKTIMDSIVERRDYYDVVISVLVLTVLKFPTALDSLLDIWGERVLEGGFRQSTSVRQLVDFRQGDVILRSSVAARYILQRTVDASVVVEILGRIARVAADAAGQSRQYGELARNLMRFSNLQAVLPQQNRRASVVRYYESIKNLPIARNNPQFWLQYAIAALVLEDLPRAERYFETAYSLAEKRDDYDTYMIDNHYARYLLIAGPRRDDVSISMSTFRTARRIVEQQILRDRLHYPFRVAASYATFYSDCEARLSPEDRAEIGRAAQYVAHRIAQLPTAARQQKYIAECATAMAEVVRRSGLGRDGSA